MPYERSLDEDGYSKIIFTETFARLANGVLAKAKEADRARREIRGGEAKPSAGEELARKSYEDLGRACQDLESGRIGLAEGVRLAREVQKTIWELVRNGSINSRSFYADACLNLRDTLDDHFPESE